jgi:osmoprotectant transport system ATP-binding protein
MIRLERLTKLYGAAAVVDDVSLEVAEGALLAIVGGSGSGKSTLLRMVNRLVEPSSGRVFLAGEDTAAIEPHLLRRRIGYALQNHGLFPHRTVAENVATTPRLLGWDKARIAARVDELLALFGLDPAIYGRRRPHELSGGEQQRVGVARALAAEPRVLLMDEPFGALDPVVRAKAQADLAAVRRRLGVTVLLVTHDMEEAAKLADVIAVLERGRLLQSGAPAEIIGRPATPFVSGLVSDAERPFRLLALRPVTTVLEPGTTEGPPIAADADLRQALAALIWSGRSAAPVAGPDGAELGVVRLARLLEAGADDAA